MSAFNTLFHGLFSSLRSYSFFSSHILVVVIVAVAAVVVLDCCLIAVDIDFVNNAIVLSYMHSVVDTVPLQTSPLEYKIYSLYYMNNLFILFHCFYYSIMRPTIVSIIAAIPATANISKIGSTTIGTKRCPASKMILIHIPVHQ